MSGSICALGGGFGYKGRDLDCRASEVLLSPSNLNRLREWRRHIESDPAVAALAKKFLAADPRWQKLHPSKPPLFVKAFSVTSTPAATPRQPAAGSSLSATTQVTTAASSSYFGMPLPKDTDSSERASSYDSFVSVMNAIASGAKESSLSIPVSLAKEALDYCSGTSDDSYRTSALLCLKQKFVQIEALPSILAVWARNYDCLSINFETCFGYLKGLTAMAEHIEVNRLEIDEREIRLAAKIDDAPTLSSEEQTAADKFLSEAKQKERIDFLMDPGGYLSPNEWIYYVLYLLAVMQHQPGMLSTLLDQGNRPMEIPGLEGKTDFFGPLADLIFEAVSSKDHEDTNSIGLEFLRHLAREFPSSHLMQKTINQYAHIMFEKEAHRLLLDILTTARELTEQGSREEKMFFNGDFFNFVEMFWVNLKTLTRFLEPDGSLKELALDLLKSASEHSRDRFTGAWDKFCEVRNIRKEDFDAILDSIRAFHETLQPLCALLWVMEGSEFDPTTFYDKEIAELPEEVQNTFFRSLVPKLIDSNTRNSLTVLGVKNYLKNSDNGEAFIVHKELLINSLKEIIQG